jgi:predicted aspartyl protease
MIQRMNRWLEILAWMALGSLLTSCSSVSPVRFRPQKTILASDRVAVPTFEEHGELWVEARINGAGPFRLLVDTGCSALMLSQRAATQIGLKPVPNLKVPVVSAVKQELRANLVLVEKVEMGGLALERVLAFVNDDADLENLGPVFGRPILDGVIGMDALHDVLLEMDFPNKQVSVSRRGAEHLPPDGAVPYEDVTPRVMIDIEGKQTIRCLIDTGNNGGLVLPELTALPVIYPKVKTSGLGSAAVGKSRGSRNNLTQIAGTVRLGAVSWLNPPAMESTDQDRQGNIGVTMLNRWKLVFDQIDKRIYFIGGDLRRQWAEQTPLQTPFQLGFFGILEGQSLRLLEVDPGGAADLAGLRPGDVIVSMDGLPPRDAHSLTTRARLRVRREDAEFETRLIQAPDYSPRQTLFSADRVELPTSSRRGGLIVEGRINGQGPFRFLVQTGLRSVRLSKNVVDTLQLKAMPEWAPGKTGAASAGAKIVWVDQFASNGLELKGFAALTMSDASLAGLTAIFGPLDGCLGFDALKDMVAELDYRAKKVAAIRPGVDRYPEDRAVTLLPGFPLVTAEIAGKTQVVLLDSAGSHGLEFPLSDDVPLLHPKEKIDSIVFSRSAVRSALGQLVGKVQLGPFSWINPVVVDRKPPRIGAAALAPWKVIVDSPDNKIYLLGAPLERKGRDIGPESEPRLKAGYMMARLPEGLNLLEVDPGGAFDRAGLKVGDVVLRVDETPADRVSPAMLGGRNLNHRPRLHVRRENQEFDVSLSFAPSDPAE